MTFRAGDVVRCPSIDEEWVLACGEDRGRVVAAGWPESWVATHLVTLLEAADDDERLKMLRAVAKSGQGPRAALAKRQLEAEETA